MSEQNISFDEYVKMSVEAGVPPLQMQFYPVRDFEDGEIFAYRTKMDISSIVEGYLKEDVYTPVSDGDVCGVELLRHNVEHAILAYRKLTRAGKTVDFISVRCAPDLWVEDSLSDVLTEVLAKAPSFPPSKLVLEFPKDVLLLDKERTARLFCDVKMLKVKVGVNRCGADDFLFAKLAQITPDLVFLDEELTAYAGNLNKPRYLSSLITMLSSLDIAVYPTGEDKYRKLLRTSDARGFVVTAEEPKSLEQVLKEEVAAS